MKIISNLSKRRSYNCYSGGVCYLLERNGIALSEHVSFGLSAGLNFEIKMEDNISFCAVRQLHCLTECITKLGVKVIENVEDCFEKLMINAKSKVEKDLPFMVEYDGFYFPFTQIYKKEHAKRIGLLVGYDEDNIYLSDFIYGAYEVPINNNLFRKATDKSEGACVEFKWYDVEFPMDINEKITDIEIRNSILNVTNYFLEKGHSNEKYMVGMEGMRKLASELKNIIPNTKKEKINWIDFSEDIKQSVITFSHYSNFLHDVSNNKLLNMDIEKVNIASNLIMEASKSWRIICNLFFKLGVTGNQELGDRISNKINETSSLLEKAFLLIKSELVNCK